MAIEPTYRVAARNRAGVASAAFDHDDPCIGVAISWAQDVSAEAGGEATVYYRGTPVIVFRDGEPEPVGACGVAEEGCPQGTP